MTTFTIGTDNASGLNDDAVLASADGVDLLTLFTIDGNDDLIIATPKQTDGTTDITGIDKTYLESFLFDTSNYGTMSTWVADYVSPQNKFDTNGTTIDGNIFYTLVLLDAIKTAVTNDDTTGILELMNKLIKLIDIIILDYETNNGIIFEDAPVFSMLIKQNVVNKILYKYMTYFGVKYTIDDNIVFDNSFSKILPYVEILLNILLISTFPSGAPATCKDFSYAEARSLFASYVKMIYDPTLKIDLEFLKLKSCKSFEFTKANIIRYIENFLSLHYETDYFNTTFSTDKTNLTTMSNYLVI